MTYDQLANFVGGDVADSVPASSDTIEVADVEEFADPSDGTYPLVIWDAGAHSLPSDDPNVEIVRVTDWDTEENTLTVDRGMEGTEDVSHPATSRLIHGPTAETPVEALATAGDEGTVPVAQADGRLEMDDTLDAHVNETEAHGSDGEIVGENTLNDGLSGKADDPHGNESHSEDYVTGEEEVENFSTTGDEGTVPVAQGDGSLAMADAGIDVVLSDADDPEPDVGDEGDLWFPIFDGGHEIWSFATGGSIRSGIGVSDGRVFVGNSDGNVYGLDAETGTEDWSFATGSSIQSGIGVSDGRVFVGSVDGNVYGLDAETGAEDWSFSADRAIQSGIGVSDGRVFVGSDDDNVYGLDAETGTEDWSFATGGSIQSGIGVADGRVFVGSDDDNVYGLDAETGTEDWSFSAGGRIQSGIGVSDGRVFVGSDDDNVYGLDAETGAEDWSFATGGSIQSGIGVSDGRVFVGSDDDNVYGLDADTGTEDWSFSAGGRIRSGIGVADGRVFAGSFDDNLYAIYQTARHDGVRVSDGQQWIRGVNI